MTTFLVATRNAHKVGEIRALLGQEYRFLTLESTPGAPEVVEDAPTFAGNATKKAVQLAHWLAQGPTAPELQNVLTSGDALWVLADDSGLEVDSLSGAPGVHSARFAALDTGRPGNSPTTENNAKLLRLLADVAPEKRTARFRCVIALTPVLQAPVAPASPVCYADEFELQTELFEGACEGHIALAPRGDGGFGYDPLFVPLGYTLTFGELPDTVKNRLSHRAKAIEKLRQRLARS